jgi:hypothetical protein
VNARETLVATLTAYFALSRMGRLDAHRAEAERLVDAVLKEHARTLAETIRSHPECEIGGYGDGILDASFMIDPEAP